jgi:H+/Cl- antiporter ClcA
MHFKWEPREHLAILAYTLKWVCLAGPVAAVIGTACALFLWSLEWATQTRYSHPQLLWGLPLAGAAIAGIYWLFGKHVERGSDLIMDEINEPIEGVRLRMAPLILLGTVVTHLFGGSAGREGTAVQMGGSIASTISRWLRLSHLDNRTLLLTGVAAGFGGVFGTPVTGAIFAAEFLAIGQFNHQALVPCLVASIISDWTCSAWGMHHTDYHQYIQTLPRLDWVLLGKVALASIGFGLASVCFAQLVHGVQKAFKKAIPWPITRPVLGGLLIIGLTYLLGTREYLGLGVMPPSQNPEGVSIVTSFSPEGADTWSWLWKIVFTAITLGSGFKGGEVTPLFFVGATLGNTLAVALQGPIDLFAALGFVAVFAGATNTPLACTVMGIELFGAEHAVYIATACALSYLISGHSSIYRSQRIAMPKISRASGQGKNPSGD